MQTGIGADRENQWRGVYLVGGIFGVLSLIFVIADIIIGTSLGGDLTVLPQTAIERFAQFNQNPWQGLYHLDLLNTINQIISIPVYFALFAALRRSNKPFALFALIIFLIGSTIFITNNAALPMLDLSRKYAGAADAQKSLLAAAGEGLLARGTHGSLGVFFGFFLSNIAAFLMSLVMLPGKVFSKLTAILGTIGNFLMLIYIALVTFIPSTQQIAVVLAMPGGILLLVWMILSTIRLFKISKEMGE